MRWFSIPSRGISSVPSCFMLQKPELIAGQMGLLARMQTFFDLIKTTCCIYYEVVLCLFLTSLLFNVASESQKQCSFTYTCFFSITQTTRLARLAGNQPRFSFSFFFFFFNFEARMPIQRLSYTKQLSVRVS